MGPNTLNLWPVYQTDSFVTGQCISHMVVIVSDLASSSVCVCVFVFVCVCMGACTCMCVGVCVCVIVNMFSCCLCFFHEHTHKLLSE